MKALQESISCQKDDVKQTLFDFYAQFGFKQSKEFLTAMESLNTALLDEDKGAFWRARCAHLLAGPLDRDAVLFELQLPEGAPEDVLPQRAFPRPMRHRARVAAAVSVRSVLNAAGFEGDVTVKALKEYCRLKKIAMSRDGVALNKAALEDAVRQFQVDPASVCRQARRTVTGDSKFRVKYERLKYFLEMLWVRGRLSVCQ